MQRKTRKTRLCRVMTPVLLAACLLFTKNASASDETQNASFNTLYRHYAWYTVRDSEKVLEEEGGENVFSFFLYAVCYGDNMTVDSVLNCYYPDADSAERPEKSIVTQTWEGKPSQIANLYYYNEDGSGYKKETFSEDGRLVLVSFVQTDENHNVIRDRIYSLDENEEVRFIRDRTWTGSYEDGLIRSAEIITRYYEDYIPDTQGLDVELPEQYHTTTTMSVIEYTY